jgi:hypothetical protein
VTASEGAWDLPAYEYDRTRFLEHTADTLQSKYKKLTASAIEEIKSFPTLFAYEGSDEAVRVGSGKLPCLRRSLMSNGMLPKGGRHEIAQIFGCNKNRLRHSDQDSEHKSRSETILFSYEHHLSPLINILQRSATSASFGSLIKRQSNTTTDGI